ncbi:hypothetical protein SO802_033944 [Lithocarpus litseifolius]|uniref:Uncharacterized protein n=1 Tax=Lithocarpus litseifolius TaxID=425828 RepID=A0AAW2BHH0_9ROSI
MGHGYRKVRMGHTCYGRPKGCKPIAIREVRENPQQEIKSLTCFIPLKWPWGPLSLAPEPKLEKALGPTRRKSEASVGRQSGSVLSVSSTDGLFDYLVDGTPYVGCLYQSRMKVTPERHALPLSGNNNRNGYGKYLIEEEDGMNDQNVIVKFAEIQNAISEDQIPFPDLKLKPRPPSVFLSHNSMTLPSLAGKDKEQSPAFTSLPPPGLDILLGQENVVLILDDVEDVVSKNTFQTRKSTERHRERTDTHDGAIAAVTHQIQASPVTNASNSSLYTGS